MTEAKKESTVKDVVGKAVAELTSIKHTIAGLFTEMKNSNRRHMDSSQFVVDELRRLSTSIERLTEQLKDIK